MTVTFPGDCSTYAADDFQQNYMLCAGTGKIPFHFECAPFINNLFFIFVITSHWYRLSVPIRRGITIGSRNRWRTVCCGYHVKESGMWSFSSAVDDLHPPFSLLLLVQPDRWSPTSDLNGRTNSIQLTVSNVIGKINKLSYCVVHPK